jgi:hypothetical protein
MAPEHGVCRLHFSQGRGDTPLDIDASSLGRTSNPALAPTEADGSFHLGLKELDLLLYTCEPTCVIPGLGFGDFLLKFPQPDAVGIDRLAVEFGSRIATINDTH